jgi:hypothetical protein
MVIAKNLSVEAHNAHIRDLFRDTLARVDGLSQEDFERLRDDPSEFLAAYLLPLPEESVKRPKKAAKEDVLERARAAFNPAKCHARIWNSGYGCQCSRKAGDGDVCKKHTVHHKWGLYNEPKPEDVQWKCLPVEDAPVFINNEFLYPEVEAPVEVAVEVAPAEAAPAEAAPAPVEEMPIAKMKVAELREKLKENGLSPKGKKKELIERLEEHLAAGVGLPREVIPLEEKPKRKPRKKKEKKEEKDEEIIEKEAEQAVVERFAQLEADPEVYEEPEVYEYQDVEYYIDGDELFDKLNRKRKVGTVDQDEDIILWLSPEFEREHEEKRGSQGDESDVSDVSDSE